MNHFTSPSFWAAYETLPKSVQELADQNYEILKTNPRHPSLQLKKLGGIGLYAWGSITELCLLKLRMGYCGSESGVMQNMIA